MNFLRYWYDRLLTNNRVFYVDYTDGHRTRLLSYEEAWHLAQIFGGTVRWVKP